MRKYEWRTAIEDLMMSPNRPEWLDGHTVAVAFALTTWAGWYEPKPIWPSLGQVAARAGVSHNTAQRRVALLRKYGYLRQVQRGGSDPRTGEAWATKYELTVPAHTQRAVITKKRIPDLLSMSPQEQWKWAEKNVPFEYQDEPLVWLGQQIQKAMEVRDVTHS